MSVDHSAVVRRNIEWFIRSGVMRPADGFWGVGERVAVLGRNEAAEKIREVFPAQTRLAADVVVLEHRRADCNFQAALMFDLAAETLCDPALKTIADNILDYLVNRSCLRDAEKDSATEGLWGWANPNFRPYYWTDDNAWVAAILLILARRGRPELEVPGLAAARTLHKHCAGFLQHLREKGRDVPQEDAPMLGLRLNPHWLGLVTLALAQASAADPRADYGDFVQEYHEIVMGGPPAYDTRSRQSARNGLPWALSEFAYLSVTASITGHRFKSPRALDCAKQASDLLVRNQSPAGHFRSEHYEVPGGEHLADMIYTQNWATLGLYHAAKVFGDRTYREALDHSLAFLAGIQDPSPEPWFSGCWRGLFDTQLNTWGGGDRYEGGQGSIYSGWTNAPITLAFLFEMTGDSLFADPADS